MTTSGVYEYRNKITGQCYIGSSINTEVRKRQHIFALRRGKHPARYMQNSWNKYGEDAFEFRVLEEVPDTSRLIEREQYWIDTKHPRFNSRTKAESNLGVKESPEATQAKRERQLGVPRPPEVVERIKAARANQEITEGMLQALAGGRAKLTPEQRKLNRLGQTNSDEHNRKIAEAHEGMRHLPETIEKMRNAKLGTTQDPDVVAKRIQASWGSKTEEEKAAIIAKRKATIAAKRNQSTETN